MAKVFHIEDHPRFRDRFYTEAGIREILPEAYDADQDILALYTLAREMRDMPDGIIKEEMRQSLKGVVEATRRVLSEKP